ncbi:XRE family transcriptional regulator [Ruminococcus sp. Marseille-P6503]|uniref:helix-turn-helix domain-containing protein n=1 Tax=Ruminococcus sp. Marseille-P6503 TaxID=2364796 RepID=UPI000F5483DF|nr:XRE family transcriptional regulator [Ruminococcus sp. Marseille-P6503]
MHISQIIKDLLTSKKLTQRAMSTYLGVATSTINNWLKLDRSIPAEYIIPICEFLDVTPEKLLTGKEKSPSTINLTADEQELLTYYNMLNDIGKGIVIGRAEQLAETAKKPLKEPKNNLFIEYYDLPVSAGTGIYLDHDAKNMIEVEETPLTAEANFALRVAGDSMKPLYNDGDTILIKSQPFVNDGEIGVFIVNGEGYVKKFGGNCLISINPEYKDIKLNDYDQVYCKGKVIGVL